MSVLLILLDNLLAMALDVVYSYDTGHTFTAMALDVVYSYDTEHTFTAMTLDVRLQL